MNIAPFKRVQFATEVVARQIDPSSLEDVDVVHYSIPAIQETGKPALEPASDIASNKWLLQGGEVLVSKLNVHKNCIAIAESHGELLILASTEFVPFVPTGIEPRFLKYVFQSEETIQQLTACSESATRSHSRVNPSDIIKIKVRQPDLRVQALTADYLDRETARVDAMIVEKERMLALLAEKRSALISRVVTRGLDPCAAVRHSEQEWLGEIPMHWGVQPIKHLAQVGNGSTPSVENEDYWAEEGFPWLNSSVVNEEVVRSPSRFVTPKALRECHLPVIQPPAVLVGITGQGKTRGMASVLAIEATINQHLAYLKPKDDRIVPEYLRAVLAHGYTFLRSDSDGAGSTKGAITCEQLANTKVPVPPPTEQAAICAHIDRFQRRIEPLRVGIAASLSLLSERRSALISAAV